MLKRNKLYLILQNCFSSTGRAALSLLTPLALYSFPLQAEETSTKWSCGTGAKGQWQCMQKSVPGRKFQRPFHDQPQKAPQDSGPDVRRSKNLDWVDEEHLREEEKATMVRGCCGKYVEPERDYPDSDLNPEDAPLRVAASATEVTGDESARLTGEVQLTQGYRQVRGDTALLDQKNRVAKVEGNLLFREPGMLVEGESAHINLDTRNIEINNMTFVVHESGIRGTAERLTRHDENEFFIDNATYTSCEPTSNAWLFTADQISLNTEEGIGKAKNITLKIKDVPVAYFPWLRFPLDDRRVSGLLFPHMEISDENGVDFGQPIYFNLAPNYDVTITPRYIQERGAAVELEARLLTDYNRTVVGGSYLGNDDGGNDPDDDIKPYEGEDRWITTVYHTGGIGSNLRTQIDYTDVSDADYFNDLDTATLETTSKTHLRQFAEVGYRLNNWDFSIASIDLERLSNNPFADEDYKVQPRLSANGNYWLGNIMASLNNEYSSFDHDQDIDRFGDPLPTGERIHLDYQLQWDKRWVWGFFKPTAAVHYLGYDLTNNGVADNSPSATIPVYSLDTGIYLERNTSWIGNFIQTFEPRIYGLYVEFEDQSDFPEFDTTLSTFSYNQLFRQNRFVGSDRIGDAEQISVGLTTRLISADRGTELFRFSLGQAYYLEDRRVSLKTTLPESLLEVDSVYATELAFSIDSSWQFTADALYDDNAGELEKGNLYFRYQGNDGKIFNLGYRFSRIADRVISDTIIETDIDQSDISTYMPVFGSWNLVARWNHDHTNKRILEAFAGIEYNSCCWRVSLLGRKWLDRNDTILIPEEDLQDDSGIFLQIQLKGLGGTGKRIDNILSDGIIGYRETHLRDNP